jgi:hypothetical protein
MLSAADMVARKLETLSRQGAEQTGRGGTGPRKGVLICTDAGSCSPHTVGRRITRRPYRSRKWTPLLCSSSCSWYCCSAAADGSTDVECESTAAEGCWGLQRCRWDKRRDERSQDCGNRAHLAGILGLAYGSFSYTKETHDAKVGPIELSVKDKETVNVPVWAGVGAIVIGGMMLLLPGKTR